MSERILHDKLNSLDDLNVLRNKPLKTQIIGGYDPFPDKFGRTQFGTVLFEKENMVVLGGSIFILEKLFGDRIKDGVTPVSVPKIESFLPDPYKNAYTGTTYVEDGYSYTSNLIESNIVCLFGVGIGGSGESINDVKDVHYYDASINEMIPIREVTNDSDLTADEHEKYWVRCAPDGLDFKRFYLKSFENIGIYSKWRDSVEEAEGTTVDIASVHTTTNTNTPIETYVEITIRINRDDVREYFEHNANTEVSRVNSIALFSATKRELADPVTIQGNDTRNYEYDDVKMFSKLNIGNEILSLPKDLTILYRIFTS